MSDSFSWHAISHHAHTHEQLITLVSHIQAIRYINAASLAFNLWDFVISFPNEVKLVWAAPTSLVKWLFVLNRYLGPAILITNITVLSNHEVTQGLCRDWFRVEGWGSLTVVVIVQIILSLRVMALYQKSKIISRLLIALLIAHIATSSIIMYFGLKGIKPLRWIGPIFLGCVTPHIPGFLFALFIPHLLMETIIFGLTLVATVRSLPKKTRSYTPMLLLLLRDGSIYFLIMFTVTAVNAFIWALAPPSLMKCAISPLIAISSVSGCRIILNLRSLHNSDDHAVHGKLNLSTFDLGDLELRTIVAPGPGSDLALLPSSSLNLVSHEPRSEWWQGDRSSERRFGDLDLEGGSPLGGSSNDVASKKVEPASSPGTTIDVVRSRHGGWVKFTGVSTEDVTLGDRGYSETLEPSNPNPNPSSQSAEKPRPVAHRRNPDHLTTLLTAHPRKYFGWKRSQDQTSLSSQRPAATPRHSVFSIVSSDGSEGDHEEQPLSPPVTHAQHPPPMILLRIGKIAPDAWKE